MVVSRNYHSQSYPLPFDPFPNCQQWLQVSGNGGIESMLSKEMGFCKLRFGSCVCSEQVGMIDSIQTSLNPILCISFLLFSPSPPSPSPLLPSPFHLPPSHLSSPHPAHPQPGDDYEVIPSSQFIVSRTAYKDNSSHYQLNGRKVPFKEMASLLRGCGIDLDHNRFLILQVG